MGATVRLPRPGARAVVIIEDGGRFMAYRMHAADFEMRREYPGDVSPWEPLPDVPTRVTLNGWLIDGRVWTPPAEFFPDEPDAIAPAPLPIERPRP